MINSNEFSKRLQKVIDFHNLSASAFADKIGVQRSNISHILSGRNKPSLDFVMKIIKEFEDVELYWLINGKGTFPTTPKLHNSKNETHSNLETPNNIGSSKKIERIIVFYEDGTFKNYIN